MVGIFVSLFSEARKWRVLVMQRERGVEGGEGEGEEKSGEGREGPGMECGGEGRDWRWEAGVGGGVGRKKVGALEVGVHRLFFFFCRHGFIQRYFNISGPKCRHSDILYDEYSVYPTQIAVKVKNT